MPDTLARFQDDFLAALHEGDLGSWLKPGASPAGLTVYRNTVAKGSIDAIVANFPAVARLTGEDWLGAAAAEFIAAHPPTAPALISYGAGLPDWLATFPPARAMPYLADVARLDRLWTECHLAADAEPLEPAALAALPFEALASTTAVLHPSVRHAGFAHNAPTLWRAQRADQEPGPLSWEERPEGLLLSRPHGAVIDLAIGSGLHAFLDACAAGQPLTVAAAEALAAEPDVQLPALIAQLLDVGAIAALKEIGP